MTGEMGPTCGGGDWTETREPRHSENRIWPSAWATAGPSAMCRTVHTLVVVIRNAPFLPSGVTSRDRVDESVVLGV
jgi:hypothetical protein